MGFNPMSMRPTQKSSRFSDDSHFDIVDQHISHVVKEHLKGYGQLGAQQQETLRLLDMRDKEIQDRIIALEGTVQELIDIIAYMQKELGIKSNASVSASSVLEERRKHMMDSLLGVDTPKVTPIAEDSDDRRKRMQEKIRGNK